MSRRRSHLLRCSLILCGFLAAAGLGADSGKTAAGRVRLRSVEVDPVSRSVVATGWVNQSEGAIELLACGPGGKTHESVFVLNASPVDLHAALLLLGARPGRPPVYLGMPPDGPPLAVWVEWADAQGRRRERAERFARLTGTSEPLPDAHWIFSGSTFENGQYKGLAEESLLATYWDPWAVINIGLAIGSNDEAVVANQNLAPAPGTPVTVYISPVSSGDSPGP